MRESTLAKVKISFYFEVLRFLIKCLISEYSQLEMRLALEVGPQGGCQKV
jgi:hypothetical protein